MSASQTNLGDGQANTFSTNTAQTLITSEALPDNSAGIVSANVMARRASDGAVKVFPITAGYKRDTGDAEVFGVSILSGGLGTVGDLISLAAVSATFDANSDTVRVRVTGLSGQDIDWSANFACVTVNHV